MIQLPSDLTRFSTSAVIDGREYSFEFDYIGIEDRWSVTMIAPDGSYVFRGVKVVEGFPLNWLSFHELRPMGMILVVERDDAPGPVKLRDLGRRFGLEFFSRADLEAE